MKAIRIHRKGGPENLVLDEVATPTLRADDALVRVHAAAISPAEFSWHIWETSDGRSRLPFVPSHELSGVVEAVGPAAAGVSPGDAVYALADFYRDGAAAEYVAVRAAHLAPKPRALDHLGAAAVPLSALTAWQGLFDHAGLKTGDRVLIHGAAGGVGSFAVQFARWRGIRVIATVSTRSLEFVRDLGADEVIDRTSTRFEDAARDVDAVLDGVGGETTERSWAVLRPGGRLVTIVRPPSSSWAEGRAASGIFFIVTPSRPQLREIAALIDAGEIRPVVDEVFPLKQAASAYARGLRDHPRGKIVLRVVEDGGGGQDLT
jgi:NADPH:quinone reductase-like Zn-dependent oxidoreductase